MSRNAAIAEALNELASDQDQQTELLTQIRDVLVTLANDQAEIRDRLRDMADRQGTRLYNVERRVGALELVAK